MVPRAVDAIGLAMFESLTEAGFQIAFESHAQAIIGTDFAPAVAELEEALAGTTIPIEEMIAGGGGEAKGTQRLRKALSGVGWSKTVFKIQRSISVGETEDRLGPPEVRESQSHIIDHVRTFETASGLRRIALEIEWNNKDPFFDRDLENFKRLHADGAISLGIIVTRGAALHASMRRFIEKFVEERQIRSLEDLSGWGYEPTSRQKADIRKAMAKKRDPLSFTEAFSRIFVSDKFGQATTHWAKLEDRIKRGVGNPCPLILLGLPETLITFHEGRAALAEMQAAEAGDELA
jgi:hypothetical protein